MQRQLSENMNKLCQSITKPLAEIMELNVNTVSNWTKNTGFTEELKQAKKPEDYYLTQLKLANIAYLEGVTYTKKLSDIWTKTVEQANEICSGLIREASENSAELMKPSSKAKEKA